MESKEFRRTFIAIPVSIPPELAVARNKLRDRINSEPIRWIPDQSMHITLRFIGDTENRLIDKISEGLRESIAGTRRSLIHFRGVGVFRHRSMLKVIWAGIENPWEAEQLRQLTDGFLKDMLPEKELKPFRPHLTLARIKRQAATAKIIRETDQYKDVLLGQADLDRVIYFESILKPSGPEYHVLEQVILE